MVYDFKYEERKQLGRDTTYPLLYTRMLCHEQGGHNSTTGCRIPSDHQAKICMLFHQIFFSMKLSIWKIDSDYTTQHHKK